MHAIVRPILGSMTFGDTVDFDLSSSILRRFLAEGFDEIDTAHVYSDGESESILGRALSEPGFPDCSIATKVHPRVFGGLDEASVEGQVEESLRRLRRTSVDLLYLHFPDPSTDLETTLRACDRLHRRGIVRELGLSNYSVADAEAARVICRNRGWLPPTVYQGLYNGLGRRVEGDLLPTLRRHGMRFYAYNPLAGGLLSGKYGGFEGGPGPGRLSARESYRRRYWRRSLVDAARLLRAATDAAGISLPDAALRWLAFHSALDASRGDAIVIGVSRPEHLTQNLSALRAGPLPDVMLRAFEDAWGVARSESPDFARWAEGMTVTREAGSDDDLPRARTHGGSDQ